MEDMTLAITRLCNINENSLKKETIYLGKCSQIQNSDFKSMVIDRLLHICNYQNEIFLHLVWLFIPFHTVHTIGDHLVTFRSQLAEIAIEQKIRRRSWKIASLITLISRLSTQLWRLFSNFQFYIIILLLKLTHRSIVRNNNQNFDVCNPIFLK